MVKQLRVICALAVFFGLCVFPAVAAGKNGVKPTFSLVIKEGWGSIGVGDLTDAFSMLDSYFQTMSDTYSGSYASQFHEPAGRYGNVEVELRWGRGPFSLGLALAAPARTSGYADMFLTGTSTSGTVTMSEIWEPEIRMDRPILLTLYYAQPIVGRIKVVAGAGLGFYRTELRLRQIRDYDYGGGGLAENDDINASGYCFGPHFGLGLEFAVVKNVSLVLDGHWRIAKIRTFKGTDTRSMTLFGPLGSSTTYSGASEGTLIYYYAASDEVGEYDHEVMCLDSAYPEGSIAPFSSAYKVSLGLSGFSFKVGLKINLF